MLPYFKYHPDPLSTGAFREPEEPAGSTCCGKHLLHVDCD